MRFPHLSSILFCSLLTSALFAEDDFTLSTDFIYWQANQDQLIFAVSGINANILPAIEAGEYIQPDFSWNPGFRVGASYTFCECMDLAIDYTYYRSFGNKDSDSAAGSTTSTIILGNSFEALPITQIRGKWDLYFNVVNLEYGGSFCFSDQLLIRPFIGLTGTWQEQDFQIRYERRGALDPLDDVFGSQKQDQHNWGIGLRGGANGQWFLPCCLSLQSKLAFSTVWTSFRTHRKDLFTEFVTNTTFIAVDIDYEFQSSDAVIEFELGLRWDFSPSDWCTQLALQLGWEQQVWINRGQMVNLPTEGGVYNGDLNFFGLTARFLVSF